MTTERKIKAGEIARDLELGLSDAELMQKYKLSLKGLLSLYKRALEARIIESSEVERRFASKENLVALEDARSSLRVNVRISIQVHEREHPEINGMISNMSVNGLRVEALQSVAGDVKVLVVPDNESFGTNQLVLESKCCWSETDTDGSCSAGYEIIRVLQGNLKQFVARIKYIDSEGFDSDYSEEEEPTESLDLATALTEELTTSGSFSFRGVKKTLFGKLLQALPIPALLIDESHEVTFANRSCERINCSGGRIVGTPFCSLFPNSQASKEARTILEKVFQTRKREHYHAVLEVNETRIWARINFRSVRMGNERCILLLIEDLTHEKEQLIRNQEHQEVLKQEIAERKKVEQSLRESEEKYRSLVENAPMGIVLVARDGRIVAANPRFLEILAPSSTEPEKAEAFSAFSSQGAAEVFARCMAEKRVINGEIPYTAKSGKESVLRILSTPLLEPSGEARGCQAAVEDCTEQKKALEMVLQTTRFRAIGEMASGVAHNFNNLLQIVMGNSQMALTHLDWDNLHQVRKNLQSIEESARLGAQTVRRLQDFARTRSENAPANWKVFDLSKTAQEALEMTRTWWKNAADRDGVLISVKSDLEPCYVKGMENEIFEVAVNLIKNAVEALPGSGEIVVSTRSQGEHTVLEVQDSGIGIAREDLERIFAPFWTTKGLQGTGMGLASSYGIVRRHGGEISVRSKAGEGSVFSVRIPSAIEESCYESGEPKQPFDFSLNILVVDDVEPIVETIREALTSRNQRVFTALSGTDAVRIFERMPIDLILCDLGMGDMNGWQVSDRIEGICRSKGTPKPPFVLITGWGAEINAESNWQDRVDHVIEKPVDLNELLEFIQEVARQKFGHSK
ncbi:MAG: PAS domain S-box protein [Desulfomonile tiedjei]|uniref:histidine kinase n=1 Tax=Desulfomonile tiedjei TaxID=2358 RepID=A0A9D6UZH6_9BACT|nr:PAS domain S-box protein [Desulfomonile tiedjei]